MENDASTAASPRPLPSAPTRNEGFETISCFCSSSAADPSA